MQEAADLDRFLPALRGRVLSSALNISAFGMPVLTAVIAVQAAQAGLFTTVSAGLCGFAAVFPALRIFAGRLGFRATAFGLIGALLLAGFFVQFRGGATASTAALQLIVIVLCSLLFGARGALLGLGASMACFCVAAGLVLSNRVPAVPLEIWSPLRPGVWLLSGLALLFFGGTAVLAVLYMVQQLEHETRLLRATLVREQRERQRRERAESERERANIALSEAHRLEALGRLAGGVAHDFNNLLTVIVSATHHAQSDPSASLAVHENLGEINHAAERAAALTRELLLLGRKDVSRPVVVEIGALLKRLQPTLRRLLPRDIELQIDPAATGAVEIDTVRLERVLLNLVANARDAIGGAGRIALTSHVERVEGAHPEALAPGAYVALSVEDDGRGMDEATRSQVFEPYFTTKPSGKGSGLGLVTVQSFVLEAGGKVGVESAPDQGTRITLYLPDVAARVPAPSGINTLPGALRAERGRSVLVVENEAAVRGAIVNSLSRAGFVVHQAADGNRALALLDDDSLALDLICVDGVLPGASSRTLIERARSRNPAIGVVVCSGYIAEELVRRGIQTGNIGCVHKPFTPRELIECIMSQLPRVAAAPVPASASS